MYSSIAYWRCVCSVVIGALSPNACSLILHYNAANPLAPGDARLSSMKGLPLSTLFDAKARSSIYWLLGWSMLSIRPERSILPGPARRSLTVGAAPARGLIGAATLEDLIDDFKDVAG